MVLNGFIEIFLGGAAGGLLAQLANWYALRDSPNLPEYMKKTFYWIVTIAIIAAGGVLAILYGTTNVSALLAVNIGASAPLIIKALAATTPPPPPPPPHVPAGGGGGAIAVTHQSTASLVEFLAGR